MKADCLSKSYGQKAVLKDFFCDFPDGDIVCLLGESGAGKTTLLRVLMGLERPDGGHVIDRPGRFSAVFQEDTLCETVDAVKNVQIVCPNVQKQKIIEAFEKVGLNGDDLQKTVGELSGGMRRRVSIVRAMEAEGTYVFLDEPFKGLDETTRRKTIEYVLSSRRHRGMTVITHDQADAEALGAVRITLKKEESR